MKPPTKRREVRAWAVLDEGEANGAFTDKSDALFFCEMGVGQKVVPCTITYELPTKKKPTPNK